MEKSKTTLENDTSPALLHLGWFQKDAQQREDRPLLLKFEDLCHHAAILAGSGAGKSTLVGRIVEEILSKTAGRVVILDTNGDFRKSDVVLAETHRAWQRPSQKLDNVVWTQNEFQKQWRKLSRIQFTRVATALVKEGAYLPLINWGDLPDLWQLDIMGLDAARHYEEIAVLNEVRERFKLIKPVSPQKIITELKIAMDRRSVGLSAREAVRVHLEQAGKWNIWKQDEKDLDLRTSFSTEKRQQLCVFDVPSIIELNHRNILLAYLLKVLWEVALEDWEKASEQAPKDDARPPTFIVIDEAHNFIPAEDPTDPHELRISQSIQRIAAEGRKYGLFLILATQRPSKVRHGLLSECENVCLLRLRSPVERGLAVDTWALRDDNKHPHLSPLAKYLKGQGLLFGHWTGWNEIPFEGGERRTQPTGGDLPDSWVPRYRRTAKKI